MKIIQILWDSWNVCLLGLGDDGIVYLWKQGIFENEGHWIKFEER